MSSVEAVGATLRELSKKLDFSGGFSYYTENILDSGKVISAMPHYETTIGLLIVRIFRAHRQHAAHFLQAHNLYPGQELILLQLGEEDGQLQSRLIERLQIEPPTVTKMLQRLERAQLVERRPYEKDARLWRVYLTDKSRPLVDSLVSLWNALEVQLLTGLDQADRSTLRALLSQLYENMDVS